MPISTALTKARSRASKAGWDRAWIKTELDAKAVLEGCRFDSIAGQRVVTFFENLLRHSKGREWAGQPFKLLPWQSDFLQRLFGWKRKDGTRRHRRFGLWLGKKNGKSSLASGISLYLLVADGEPVSEVYNAANDRGQAGIVFTEAERMVKASPVLLNRIGLKNIVPSRKTIFDPKSGSILQALSADVPTKEGLNIHGLIVDELHAHKSRSLWDALTYGGAARTQPIIGSLSTAGVYDPASIGWEEYQKARGILNGTIEDWTFLSVVYESDPADDWTAEETWKKANPSWGVTVKADAFAEECADAQRLPTKENTFRRYRLNQWVQQITRWIPMDTWDRNVGHERITVEDLHGRICYGGLDLGSVSDMTALAYVSDCEEQDGAVDVVTRFWVPEAQLLKSPNKELYRQWVKEGWLVTTPGNSTDYSFVKAQILADAELLDLVVLNIDRLFQGQQLMTDLAEEGIPVAPIGQGFMSMAAPTREFERLLLSHGLHHGGNPILRWQADNVVVRPDSAGNLKVDKERSPQKVDGIVAVIDAIDGWNRREDGSEVEANDSQGITWLD